MRTIIRKARLQARMTQVQVAEAVGVSQPTYQRWESGTIGVSKSKAVKLAEVLGITLQQVEGRSEPFDLFGIKKGISDERQYFGEIAIHFGSGSSPLLLPVSEAERTRFCSAIQGDDAFVQVVSLDNRMVFVRRKAIADVYFSSEAYDDYGPEGYGAQHLDVHPDDVFWKIVEYLDCTECLDGEFSEQEINDVVKKVSLDDSDLDELIANGSIKPEERDKVRQEVCETTELYVSRARDITWQLPSNRNRYVSLSESKALYETFCTLTMGDEQELLYLAPEGYHRSIFLSLSAVDFISVPAHKFREGELENVAEEVSDTE